MLQFFIQPPVAGNSNDGGLDGTKTPRSQKPLNSGNYMLQYTGNCSRTALASRLRLAVTSARKGALPESQALASWTPALQPLLSMPGTVLSVPKNSAAAKR
eukprot:3029078-Lingulodinium_polyedra.AAC.1